MKHCFIFSFSLFVLLQSHSLLAESNPASATNITENPKSVSQRNLPIAIEADSAEQLEQQGLTIYRGNVTMIQGNLRIEAAEIQIHSIKSLPQDNRRISEVVANGDLAMFSHTDEDDTEVIARAKKIDYAPLKDTVVMSGNASLVQQGSSVRGDKIEYFISEQKVKAASISSSPGAKEGRVKTVITPGQGISFGTKKEESASTPSPAANQPQEGIQ